MIYIVLGLIGAVAGSLYLYGRGGFLLGGVIGLLTAAVINQRNRMLALEKRLEAVATQTGRSTSDAPASPTAEPVFPPDAPDADPAAEAPAEPVATAIAASPPSDIPSLDIELSDAAVAELDATSVPPAAPPPQQSTAAWGDAVRQFLFGGNLMVRVGVVVLLFGFAFLVKYAATRDLVPLEVRLTLAFAAGIGLLLLGWRLRDTRFGYAVALQGGGVGVMYLTLFAAARLFQMVPLPLTFGVMVGLVAFSGMLAVLQQAASMAVLGAAGGFLAPVLLSTGTGNHVMLFAYYAVLNAGIFGIAWFNAWRWLNLLGFVFTFGIGAAWGLEYYQPHHFATTEPFLVLFFCLYLGIAVLFALRQPPRLKGLVDGTLVFGLPLVAFGLQAGLVNEMAYGLAFSALILGLIYATAATTLWRRRDQGLDALVEAFLALAIVFGSLAIPLALSGSWTAVAWSLEGAGLVWVGLRQQRWTARGFGILLQIGSGMIFLADIPPVWNDMAMLNGRFLGGMLLGASGLGSAFFLERFHDRLHRLERPLAGLMMVWGLLWWFGTGWNEIDRRLSRRHELSACLAFAGVNGLAMGFLYVRLDWKMLRWPAMGLLPVAALSGVILADQHYCDHPFQDEWSLVWPLMMVAHLVILRCMETGWKTNVALAWHVTGGLLAGVLLAWEGVWLLDWLAAGGPLWSYLAWGGLPAVLASLLIRHRNLSIWPFAHWPLAYRGWLPLLLTGWMLAWTVAATALSADPRPLPYLPLINPLDILQVIVFLVIGGWVLWVRRDSVAPAARLSPGMLWGVPAVAGFIWLTTGVARCVHHFAAVPYDAGALFHSGLFQAAIAVLWGLLAFGCMVAASRSHQRSIWFVGAGLLAVVVVKLFAVDLSESGTVSRIVSFLAVGGLMLVVGFFSPLPPAKSKGEGA